MNNKRNIIILTVSILGIAVLAGAAYLATRLINHQVAAGGAPVGIRAGEPGPAGKPMIQQGPTIVPSELIPQRDPNVTGQVASIKDNSIFVSVVVLEGVMDPKMQDLPPTEVVVTQDTKIFKSAGTESVTDASGKTVEKKKEELVTIDVLGKDYIVNIWGEKRGDRYYADVITYIEM
jgi:hypothetical protein